MRYQCALNLKHPVGRGLQWRVSPLGGPGAGCYVQLCSSSCWFLLLTTAVLQFPRPRGLPLLTCTRQPMEPHGPTAGTGSQATRAQAVGRGSAAPSEATSGLYSPQTHTALHHTVTVMGMVCHHSSGSTSVWLHSFCETATRCGRSLQLQGRNLRGPLPASISALTSLQYVLQCAYQCKHWNLPLW